MIRMADGYISTSSIMPQKRNPIALEHLRASLSVVKGMADTVQTGFLKSPYGDISDYEDIEDTMHQCLELLGKNLVLFQAVLATLEVDRELLERRAFESFSVVTEIADQMYRSYEIPFRKAHSFVAFLVKKAGKQKYNLRNITEKFFAESYQEFFGEEFREDFRPILDSVDPWHFVRVREVWGGTGPRAMEEMLRTGRQKIRENREWLELKQRNLEKAHEKRREQIKRLIQS